VIRLDQISGVVSGRLLAIPNIDLELWLGQELQGRVLRVSGSQALISLGEHHLWAQTQVPLAPGDWLRLVVADKSEEQVVLRLTTRGEAAARTAMSADDLSQLLQGLGLPADPMRLQLARSLLARGLPLSRAALEAAGALLAGDADAAAVEAAADLLARGLPLTERSLALALSQRGAAPLGEQMQALREDVSGLQASLKRLGGNQERLSRLQKALDGLSFTDEDMADARSLAERLVRLVRDLATPTEAKLRSGARGAMATDLRALLRWAVAELGRLAAGSPHSVSSDQLASLRKAAAQLNDSA